MEDNPKRRLPDAIATTIPRRVSEGRHHVLLFGATSTKDERVRRSQDNFKVIARDESMEYRDFESLWGGYLDKIHQKIGYVAATKDNHVISKEQWRAWYRQLIEKRDELEIQF